MSIAVMTRVWKHSRAKGSALLLLLAIADHADDAGVAYPSVTTLATKIRMTRRNAGKLIAALEAMGELRIEGESDYKTHLFRVMTGDGFQPDLPKDSAKSVRTANANDSRGGAKNWAPECEESGTEGANTTSHKPSLEPSHRTVRKVAAAAAESSPLDSLSPAQRDVFGEIDLSMGRYMREPDIFSELLLFVQDYAPDEARECLRTVRARGEKAFPQNLRRVALAEIGGPLWQRERDKNRRAAFNQGGPYLCACGFAGSLSEVRAHKREQHEEGYA